VDNYFDYELEYNINRLNKFGKEVSTSIYNLWETIVRLNMEGRVVGVSAPAKGNTLLNCLDDIADVPISRLINYITEKSLLKVGKYTPGSHIPVKSDEKLILDQPDYAIIFAHNWAEQIKESLKDYKGEWIIPNGQGLKDLYRRSLRVGRLCNRKRVATQGV